MTKSNVNVFFRKEGSSLTLNSMILAHGPKVNNLFTYIFLSIPKNMSEMARLEYVTHTLGDKIHLDVCGPANPQSYNGKLYYVSFIDDHTGWTTVYCITKKYKEY